MAKKKSTKKQSKKVLDKNGFINVKPYDSLNAQSYLTSLEFNGLHNKVLPVRGSKFIKQDYITRYNTTPPNRVSGYIKPFNGGYPRDPNTTEKRTNVFYKRMFGAK